jgi:hypothetical protein
MSRRVNGKSSCGETRCSGTIAATGCKTGTRRGRRIMKFGKNYVR